MPTIEIRELRRLDPALLRFAVGVRFDGAEEYAAVVGDPFSPADEALLAWYFEEHLRFPFTRGVDADRAAASVERYGEALFQQVFEDREAYLAYGREVERGVGALAWAVSGSADFHRLHWEALKDPRLPRAFALEGTMVRQNLKPRALAAGARSWPALHLLVVTARPFGPQDVGARTISRPLIETLRQSTARVEVDLLRPGTYKALENHLQEVRDREGAGYYHAVHFDVHGGLLTHAELQKQWEGGNVLFGARYGRAELPAYAGQRAFLFLEGDADGQPADPVEAGEVAALLTGHQIPVAILNACQSGKPLGEGGEGSLGSRLLEAGLQVVLAMGYSVTVSAARLLMRELYGQLFSGQELKTAIRRGRLELHHDRRRQVYFNQSIELEDWLLPVVYQNREVRFALRDQTPAEAEAWYAGQHGRFRPPEPAYGFFGRDLDVLAIERRLLRNNLLLVQGMGGAGKTTLLQHLGAWWQETGWVEQVFSFGWDERAWNLQQLGDTIAGRLLPAARFHGEFRPLSSGAQAAWLAERLRGERHLLILDNLESITGSALAIGHTLPAEEREALRRFLADLKGGRTLVLLGSRGGEEWLSPGTFGENVHELRGLDEEAASALADQVLARVGASRHREDEDLKRLLRLLAGYPLALQVVLQNLARQSPQQVLAGLEAGDVDLDAPGAQAKTASILLCIDYSHRHLSAEAQGLLACLAPFTGVVPKELLPRYTELLREEPALHHLPFERWEETLREAEGWGLLKPHEIPLYLSVQPTLPYFLRSRLRAAERAKERQAIERAFRRLYQEIGEALAGLLHSKEPQQRQAGQVCAGLEYENLSTALDGALAEQVSIEGPYKALSFYLDARQDHRRGLELGQRVLARIEDFPPEKLKGQIGFELVATVDDVAQRYLLTRQFSQAEAAYQKALDLFQGLDLAEERKGKLISGVYHQLGRVAEAQRQWQQAETYYQTALQIDIDFNDRYAQAKTYHNLGIVAQEQRQWQQAETYYQKALRICIEFDDRYTQASTYYQLGRVAEAQRQWQQAETYYQTALQIDIDFNDRYAQADTYHSLGSVAQKQRQWEQAETYYQKALQIKIDFNDHYAQARTYHNLGIVAQVQRQWQQAETYYQKALKIDIDFNDRYAQADTYHNLGSVAEEQRQWEQAREYYLTALEIYAAYQDSHSGGIVFGSLARLWRASGDATLPAAVAGRASSTTEEVEERFRAVLDGGA
jgi:tetratricopeptide (TPR) repeat protein